MTQKLVYYRFIGTSRTLNVSSFLSKCKYCNQSDFGSADGYERNVVVHRINIISNYQTIIWSM